MHNSVELSDLGSADYQLFDRVVVLDKVMRQAGEDASQEFFRNILLRLRDGNVTVGDWEHLMTQTPAKVSDPAAFNMALHLYPTVEATAEYNISKLRANGQPVATINAVHTGRNAAKASTDDAGGLESVVCLAHGDRVMLTANLWVDVGLPPATSPQACLGRHDSQGPGYDAGQGGDRMWERKSSLLA